MSHIYIEYHFNVSPLEPAVEILIAELGQAGFESFVETETGLNAYIQKTDWSKNIIDDLQILNSGEFEISHVLKEITPINWNKEWEKNFSAIEVDDTCVVRAPFHKSYNFEYEIIIEPKMSFGTGHHETTFMMLQYILENDFKGKSVLDMGCGTAVLAILAEMRGASAIDGVDIDEWCYENSIENIERNHCQNISVFQGDASFLIDKQYDIIIANINRNILLQDMETYRNSLRVGADLYLSGFYKKDLPLITEMCNKLGLKFVSNKEKNKWNAAKFVALNS